MVIQVPPVALAGGEAAAPIEPQAEEPLPPAVALPAAIACLIDGPWQGRDGATPLRLRDGGPVFAEVGGGVDAQLHLPQGRPAGAAIELDTGGVSLRGRVDAAEIPLRPARPVAFQGFAVPFASTLLDLQEAGPGWVAVACPAIEGVEPLAPPLAAQLPCNDVTASELEFVTSAAAGAAGDKRPALLRVGRPIPLSVAPGGPAVAKLHAADDEDAEVSVVGVEGGRSRVLWWRDEALIFGWIPTADLRRGTPANQLGEMFGMGGLGLRGEGEGDPLTCAADVPLVAEAGGERATVGLVRAGTAIEILERGGPYARVAVDLGATALAEGASLKVRAADLAGCARQREGQPR
jgi:hypothetical protein